MPIVTLLTDFGHQDGFVGCLHGVILTRCPSATIVDLCHEIRPYDVPGASFLLEGVRPCFGPGTIHVAVVDPGVGGPRRPVLALIDGQFFVAPDNGLLTAPLERARQSAVRELTAGEFWRHPVSHSFHGRDIFAPVAGHLAAGVAPDRFGPLIADPVRLTLPRARHAHGQVQGEVIWVDRFGNCVTNIPGESLASGVCVWHAGQPLAFVDHFGGVPAGSSAALVGSSGYVELFVNQGDFAKSRSARVGDEVILDGGAVESGQDDGRHIGPSESRARFDSL
ncbi:MAG TPA: SAM-dependent chlorinase/fluorinase [Candidatus Baltobacteraceae bacterium]|nr:SAM-dependent chlorinase/fluorinase [Candidatus Baltobacteraceae bacterium]